MSGSQKFFDKLDHCGVLFPSSWSITIKEHQRSACLEDRIGSNTISPIWCILEVIYGCTQISLCHLKELFYFFFTGTVRLDPVCFY
jgi:hypothetical protein